MKTGLFHAAALSAKDLLVRALFFGALFAIAHLTGLREHTSFLSGTVGSAGASWQWSSFWGAIYVFLYLAFVILVPIFLMASALVYLAGRRKLTTGTKTPAGATPERPVPDQINGGAAAERKGPPLL